MREHLVVTGLLHVENLSLDGQNRLRPTVPALFCGTAGRITFYDEYLCCLGRPFLAIRQFARQGHAVEGTLPPHQFTRTTRCLTGARCLYGFTDDFFRERRIFV